MFEKRVGDIKDFRGDYVINPSNTILKLGSGVSGVLRMMCPKLQKVMDEWVRENGFLNPGDIVVTEYPCDEYKFAIHAAVMDYRPFAKRVNPDYERIEMICKNVASFLEGKDVVVITPLLGTGVGGLDKKRVEEIMEKYFEKIKARVVLVKKI
jgi:O-acetyl-ADP-ribose deacetylase (regulator of RNase III)